MILEIIAQHDAELATDLSDSRRKTVQGLRMDLVCKLDDIGVKPPEQPEAPQPTVGGFPAKTVETMIDKLTMLAQEGQINLAAAVFAQFSQLFQVGAFATLDAAANATPFIAIVTDNRTISVFLGDRGLGTNGWTTIGGF